MHVVLERSASSTAVVEKRYSTTVLDWVLTGQIDMFDGTVLYDYKLTSAWTYVFGIREEWIAQSNVNRWLMHKNEVDVKSLKNILFFRDWSESKVGGKYPDVMVKEVDLPMWSLEDTETYVKRRISMHQASMNLSDEMLSSIYPCSDEDRWFNRKSQQFLRCEKYCPVRNLCRQRQNAELLQSANG